MTDFICPVCRGDLDKPDSQTFACPRDLLTFPNREGIWRFLPPAEIEYYQTFIRDYETIRKAEGRGSSDPAYYRRLPFEDLTGTMNDAWKMRTASFHVFMRKVLPTAGATPAHILDLGSGTGWLAYRLAQSGHQVEAVDLLTNDWDGLGAHVHYDTKFRPVQASFSALPYKDEQFDIIVFNASFHYSVDYPRTLAHVLRLLKPAGILAIIDTPVYQKEASGVLMVRERSKSFKKAYGFRSDALPLENYLTFSRLNLLAEAEDLDIKCYRPWFGLRHFLDPFRARLRGRREPARFPVVVLKRKK